MGSKRIVLAVLMVGFIVSESSAQFNLHRRRGTVIGGVAGAAIGAAIGDRNNNEAVGAVIGATTGAVIGRSIGTNKDHRIEQNMQYHNGHQYTQPRYVQPYPQQHVYHVSPQVVPVAPPIAPAAQTPISHDDVVSMLRSGLSEQMVALQVQRRGVQYSLGVNDIIRLHQNGVSEGLIDLMQANAVSTATPPIQPANSVQAATSAYYPPQPQQQYVPQQTQQHSPYGQSIMAPANGIQPAN